MVACGLPRICQMNPFISFCLYVAARVFVQYLKTRPGDEQVRSSLQFLLTAMTHLKDKNPLTESFLVQLDVDLTGSLDAPVNNSKFPYGLKKGQVGASSISYLYALLIQRLPRGYNIGGIVYR